MQIFICYSRADTKFASELVEQLSAYNLDVWMDMRSIPHGANWDIEVQRGLDSSDLMLVLLTPSSVASQNVADEWSYFVEKNKPVMPLLVEPCEVPFRLSRRQRVDFTQNYESGFRQLLKAMGSPEPRDPESTQRIVRPVAAESQHPEPQPVRSGHGASKPSVVAAPAKKSAPSIAPEVGVKMLPVIWADAYHWFNGMGANASHGDIMIDSHEVKLIPHARPIMAIPLRSVVSAKSERSVDHYLRLTYYDSKGVFCSLAIMGLPKDRRKEIAEEIVNLLKLVTGRSLT